MLCFGAVSSEIGVSLWGSCANEASLVVVQIFLNQLARIKVMGKAVDIRSEGIESAVDILAEIDTARLQARQKFLKSDDLVLGKVTAIVDDDVNSGNFLPEAFSKFPVALVADEYVYGVAFIGFAGWFDINAEDLAARAEIISPHFQAAAAIDADLQDAD